MSLHTISTKNTAMWQFLHHINQTYQLTHKTYNELHQWSIINMSDFWSAIWDFCQVIGDRADNVVLVNQQSMEKAIWFPRARLNFAENLLKHNDQHTAILYQDENSQNQQLSYAELRQQVAKVAEHLKQLGLAPGDRVAACLPNCPQTVIAMLATTSLGAIWSCCSPDFGYDALSERFTQIEPTVLFAVDSHGYQQKQFNHIEKIKKLGLALKNLRQIILLQQQKEPIDLTSFPADTTTFQQLLTQFRQTPKLAFKKFPFNHPVYILYTSGTTGKPKCMVHSAGGTLLQHLKELQLHTNLTENDRLFFYSSCGWMMWNWSVSVLALGSTLVLYEGSPFSPNDNALFDLIDRYQITHFGIGAKFFESIEKKQLEPNQAHSLTSLKTILTTGSPLLPASFDFILQHIKKGVQISSISGGSDIISCFALGNPLLPVHRGQLQCIGLGMDVKIYNEQGISVQQQKGELVCCSPFPSMPVYFWNDPDRQRYHQAYFDKYPNCWAHGDYAEITEQGGMIIYGRNDTTLNPAGIRIGTAEIYRQVEKIAAVIDCLAVGQQWQSDERIILFVVLQKLAVLDEKLVEEIKNRIRQNSSPHHVPAKIIQVSDLPRTISGKTAELIVKKLIHHQPIDHLSALANPESLENFKDLEELTY